MKYFIDIIRYETDEVVKRLEAPDERTADHIEDGININLDHERFYTLMTAANYEGRNE